MWRGERLLKIETFFLLTARTLSAMLDGVWAEGLSR
jgi:hypothetical protein